MKKIYTLILLALIANISQAQQTCSTAVTIVPAASCNYQTYTTSGTEFWLKFIATSPTVNISVVTVKFGINAPHIHHLELISGTCSSQTVVADDELPFVFDAKELAIDLNASGLIPGNTYYIRAERQATGCSCTCNKAACTASGSTAPATFNICVENISVIIPLDFGLEAPASSNAYITNRGQLIDVNNNPVPDIKLYTIKTNPNIYFRDNNKVSYVFAHIDTIPATPDTLYRVDMSLVGANSGTKVFKTEQAPGITNYYLAHIPGGVTGNKGYYRSVSNDVYPNIDMQWYSNSMGEKFYFIVRPGGDADNIVLQFDGATSVNVTGTGGLIVTTPLGNIEYEAAHAYQVNPGGNIVPMPWQAEFIQLTSNSVKFDIRSYPHIMPLFIQVDRGHSITPPQQPNNTYWCTYYGGSSNSEEALDSHIDDQNNLYVAGWTMSSDFPVTPGAIQSTNLGWENAVIMKFNTLRGRDWATYYGGSMNDIAYGITTDELYNVYFTGRTSSVDFPECTSCPGFYQPSLKGNYDAFIVKLKPDGTAPQLWATYFGGNVFDCGYAIAYKNPYLYVIGESVTEPTPFNLDFPVKSVTGAYNQLEHGDKYSTISGSDVFIAKFTTDGNQVWTTFLGGEGNELPTGCAVDNNGNLFVSGGTWNIGCLTCTPVNGKFPLCDPGGGAYVHSNAGEEDAFIAKFDITGALTWSTEYGGESNDISPFFTTEESTKCIAVDNNGNIYTTGSTSSLFFPVYPETGAYNQAVPNDINPGDWSDIYILKFTSTDNLLWSTLWGGNYYDFATAIAADPVYNRIYIAGCTYSDTLLPLKQFSGSQNYYWQPNLAGFWDDFLITLNENDTLEWATYFGGADQDYIHSISVSPQLSGNTNIVLVGGSASANYPVQDIPGTSDYFVGNLSGSMDITIAEFVLLPGVTGIKEESINENLQVYPNPSSESITVCLAAYQNKHAEINIYDAVGKMVYRQKLNIVNERNNINISSLTDGLYLMKVKIDDKVFNYKLIKIKEK